MLDKNKEMESIFPDPPMVSNRRTKNIEDKIVRAKHWPTIPKTPIEKTNQSKISHCMNQSTTITNKQNNKTCTVSGGSPADTNIIYAAECLRHEKLYVGQTKNKLSTRFVGHRSDTIHNSDRCDLPKHFHNEGCSFNTDLEITILEKVNGASATLLKKEDQWITRLDTIEPNGLNSSTSEFGHIYKRLFK